MSQENVEMLRQAFEAFIRGDWDARFESFSPEVEWEEMPSLGPDASSYRGIGKSATRCRPGSLCGVITSSRSTTTLTPETRRLSLLARQVMAKPAACLATGRSVRCSPSGTAR